MSAVGDRAAVERIISRVSDYCRPEYGPGGGFRGVDDLARANANAGFHFFDPETRRWFSSRVGSTMYGGRFFVTSEQDRHGGAWGGARLYSIRFARVDASIESVGEFGAYETSAQANRAAARAAHLFALRAAR